MKLNYQQPHNIKMPWWMNEVQRDHYKIKEHHRQKKEQMEIQKIRVSELEKYGN